MTRSLRAALSAVTVAAVTVGTFAVASPAYATAPDPAVAGALAVTTLDYDAGRTWVTDPSDGLTYPEELEGRLYVPSGTGPYPVVMLLHGRHETCSYGGITFLGPPYTCPDTVATANVRSYRGYDYLGSNLASHGYLVVSASANAINSFDIVGDAGAEERAQVIARTLDLLYDWTAAPGPAPVNGTLVGKVDLSRIGLMGHSRGGEAVDHFVDYNRRRTDGRRYPGLTAVFALAPTDFGADTVYGVHYATLLPLCDGDVYDLEGSWAYDRGRFTDPAETHTRAQYTLTGANHNFFNTVWDFDDYSGNDSACTRTSSTRLTASDQRDVGLVLMAAFFRRWVGNETAFDALVKGAEALPASACPGAATACPTLVRTSYLAPAAKRTQVAMPGGATVTTSGLATFATCTPNTDGVGCPTYPTRSIATQWTAGWTAASSLTATVAATDVRCRTALTFRTGVNYDDARNTTAAQNLDVTLTDANGGTATVNAAAYTASLREPAGDADRELTLDGVWIPLSAFAGVDLSRVTSVRLGFGTRTASGSIQLAELAFQA